jgi:hypothetical protein
MTVAHETGSKHNTSGVGGGTVVTHCDRVVAGASGRESRDVRIRW